ILIWFLRRKLGRFDPAFGVWFARVALVCAGMAAVAAAIRVPLEEATTPGAANRLLQVMLLGYAMAVVAGAYFLFAYYLRIPQVRRGLALVANRIPAIKRVIDV
ncbi:MAG TPA: hypothetical protein VFL82_06580, partial [Thermomicrobiales bacterium]|nr:hypothetical protein [Thermomicrobiales bacterium]